VRKQFLIVLVFAFCFPIGANAEYESTDYRWGIEYSYSDGIVLCRYLGPNWMVLLGGKPDNHVSTGNDVEYRDAQYEGSELTSITVNDYSDIGGQASLGIGRLILHDKRFALSGMMKTKYRWKNFESKDTTNYVSEERSRTRNEIGHSMTSSFYFGLRPSYELTSRISLIVELGVYFSHYTYTRDRMEDSTGDHDFWIDDSNRESNTNDAASLYGYSGINSVRFMFRF